MEETTIEISKLSHHMEQVLLLLLNECHHLRNDLNNEIQTREKETGDLKRDLDITNDELGSDLKKEIEERRNEAQKLKNLLESQAQKGEDGLNELKSQLKTEIEDRETGDERLNDHFKYFILLYPKSVCFTYLQLS